jgi:hypothetical protein
MTYKEKLIELLKTCPEVKEQMETLEENSIVYIEWDKSEDNGYYKYL